MKEQENEEKVKDFILLTRLFNSNELQRIEQTAKDLGLLVEKEKVVKDCWQLIGLNPHNRSEVHSFFELAEVEIQ